MSGLDYKELQKEFDEAFGVAYNGFEEDTAQKKEQEKLLEQKKFLEAITEAIDAYVKESVEHFLRESTRNILEDGRYFYSSKELKEFKTLFEKRGGQIKKIHIGIIRDECGDFFCYEVCHDCYYTNPNDYVKKVIANAGLKKLFYS